jgi:putative ABC transport system permease protein
VLVLMFPDQLPGGFVFSPLGAGLAVLGSVWAGLLGGVWPAVAAARTSPLEGLAARARPVRRRWVWACVFAGVALPGLQWAAMVLPRDSTMVFWSYVLFGLPVMMVGYFLLGVPVTALMGRVVSPVVSAALRLPRGLLGRTIAATPFRHGFTAASMMLGLALMVSIWTNGRAVLRDWLDAIALPDAFIYGHNFKAGVAERIRGRVPEVVNTCAITIQNLETGSSAAVKGLGTYKTSFVGFEPRPFFEMTRLAWVEMDGAQVARAKARLEEGGAVIVSREYAVTRKVGLGETVTVRFEGRTIPFEVVGIVASPGLDLVSKFLEIGDQYLDQSVNAICGSREDLKRHFGNDAVNFIQLNFREGADGKAALKAARAAVGPGVRFAVTAADMKAEIRGFISGSLMVMSVVGIGAMLVSCLGVANLIIAGVHARRFELGVLRAVGAGGAVGGGCWGGWCWGRRW